MNLEVTEIVQVINLTVIDQTTTTEYEITEVVETIHLTIDEKFGSDGPQGSQGPPGPIGPPGTSIKKTSELINDGENGTDPFITLLDIPEVILPTNTSDLINDGEDGVNPFITIEDVPAQTPQVKSDWNATSGPEEILNKPTIPVIVPQEQSDWNAVSGVSFIKNKPTIPAPVDISGKLDKPTTPNNVPTRVVNADNSTSDKGEFQLSEQIEIGTNTTAQASWKGKEIWVTASCTLTIPLPSTLSAEWNIDILVFPSATLTLAITSPGTWLHTTPGTITDTFFRIARRGNTTTFKTLGL